MSTNLFPTSPGKQKALPACAGLSAPREAGGGGRSSAAATLAQAQRERLGVDGVWTCRMNIQEGKVASPGSGSQRAGPERNAASQARAMIPIRSGQGRRAREEAEGKGFFAEIRTEDPFQHTETQTSLPERCDYIK